LPISRTSAPSAALKLTERRPIWSSASRITRLELARRRPVRLALAGHAISRMVAAPAAEPAAVPAAAAGFHVKITMCC
jgi:hypothetical protein